MALRGEDEPPDTMKFMTMMPGNKRRVVKEQSKYQKIEVWETATDAWDDHNLTVWQLSIVEWRELIEAGISHAFTARDRHHTRTSRAYTALGFKSS
jgi:hypothetical protein